MLCTFWLAHALALTGSVAEGTEVFERASAYVNDVGLVAEEVDSATGELVGNFPQAFSHIGLVNAAWALDQARPFRVLARRLNPLPAIRAGQQLANPRLQDRWPRTPVSRTLVPRSSRESPSNTEPPTCAASWRHRCDRRRTRLHTPCA